MTDKKYYTVEEVNQMIPELEHTFLRLFQLTHQIDNVLDILDESGIHLDEDIEPDELLETLDAESDAYSFDAMLNLKLLSSAVEEIVSDLQKKGCIIKDIRTGLCDWQAKQDEEEIYLSWKYGEKSVKHWHNTKNDFENRRSISELELLQTTN